jgi:outer membrane protein insertion porin family
LKRSEHREAIKIRKPARDFINSRSPRFTRLSLRPKLPLILFLILVLCLLPLEVSAQENFQDRIISNADVTFEGAEREPEAVEQLRLVVGNLAGERYSLVRVRESLQILYNTERIVSAQVEARETGPGSVGLRFIVTRRTQADRVIVRIGNTEGDNVTEAEILLRVNLLNPGMSVTQQTLRTNADLIQSYLRERGFYNAEVTYTQTPLQSPTRVAVTFQVNPNAQARVENFAINIAGFDAARVRENLRLKPGTVFSQRRLTEDVERIRQAMLRENYLAPNLEETRFTFDPERNTVAIELRGEVGPTVNVEVNAARDEPGRRTQQRILPIKREGTLEFSAIIEGVRRLRNYYQERGYFFAEVEAICSVRPALSADETGGLENETLELCGTLMGADLSNKEVTVIYNVNLNRRFRLTDIRIEGTDRITYEDVAPILDTQKTSLLSWIPRLGYGRGYTSNEILESDRQRLQSVMRELGYREARVTVRQGVDPTGDDLIITFAIEEGIPTVIESVEITGNQEFTDAQLRAELPELVGRNYSRARIRNGVQKLSELYSREGYYDARVSYSIDELPDQPDATEDRVRIVYTIENEGSKVFISRILINGNDRTDTGAILRAITLTPGDVLRSTDIFTSEQNLYASDAFTRVEIRPEPAGQTAEGNRKTDVIINVEEQKPRVITYGGGFSTDEGAFGSVDLRHSNLFGKLQQGSALIRMSRTRQLAQINYLNPRFIREGKNRFAPLSITAQYQRDSTVTRFFRSTFDQGTFGIVQRVDEEGNPIDVFGEQVADPTLHRLTLTAETSRTLHRESRSILFLRYRFEDVRLYNIESLLIADLLRPDDRNRVSGFGASFVRDTRRNCTRRQSLLEIIRRGEMGDPCRYNASDPTHGSFITADYNVSLPALGANIGFSKFQTNIQSYYTFGRLKKTTLAGRLIFGAGSVFSEREGRFADPRFEALRGSLPISERFFAGGSTTLRGFDFEGAGPRIVVIPEGIFRNQEGEPVTLNPFTVPFGGNALMITNLEARLPLTDSIQAVTFYDGGNVFRNVKDIFRKPEPQPDNVFLTNLQSRWTNTVGFGLRIKIPVGGSFAIDYGYLLNPPEFLIPQADGSNAIFRPKQGRIHFRFAQIF